MNKGYTYKGKKDEIIFFNPTGKVVAKNDEPKVTKEEPFFEYACTGKFNLPNADYQRRDAPVIF
ncbi:MAG: hypothetical protein MJZ01_00190 [Bacteroidales bacterium]|nr:hypothetical protein [Bacteroidales bacterium]